MTENDQRQSPSDEYCLMAHEADKYSGDANWAAAFDKAWDRACAVDARVFDARTFATISADLAVLKPEETGSSRGPDLEATRARIASFEAERAAQAEATPDPDQQAKAALARAVAALNARRGHGANLAAQDSGKTSSGAEKAENDSADPALAQGVDGGSPWAKAVARVNQGR